MKNTKFASAKRRAFFEIENFKYEVSKFKERRTIDIVWALPPSIVYWAAIRLMVNATVGQYSNQEVPKLTAMEALNRWPDRKTTLVNSAGKGGIQVLDDLTIESDGDILKETNGVR